ncbi:MutT/NUDIX family protein [Leptospira kirschneri str. 200801925]|nr:MutT/NUDIX family protein [Leptospira kirschneri str. 200801925]
MDGKFSVSSESEEIKLFSVEEIPWEELAFTSVSFALRKYVDSSVKNSLHLGNTRDRKNISKGS